MRSHSNSGAVSRRSTLVAGTLLVLAMAAQPAAVRAGDDATYAVRVYEVYQRGPKLRLEVRTPRAFGPGAFRNIQVGEVMPPEDKPPLRVTRSRNHVDYFASYWREDGTWDRGTLEVEVWEVDGSEGSAEASLRVRLVERENDSDVVSDRSSMASSGGGADGPRHGLRLYEVFHRGPKLALEERTTRYYGPPHRGGVVVGQPVPPSDQAPLKVWKSRDHIAFVGSYWREDGVPDFDSHEVIIEEVAKPDDVGVAYVRAWLSERESEAPGPRDRFRNPERRDRKNGRRAK